jgi:tRNA(Ile)-lysidine synthase
VLALVSGGADSTCLMHLLAELHDGPTSVLTIDHGLRREAAAEAAGVAEAARGLGLPVRVERLSLARGAGAPERARAARLALARRVAAEDAHARVATGHTASDQAETVLFRLARGTGRTGALGMAPRRGPLVRPLLDVTGAETRAWCAERGLAPVEDPANGDRALARTRVRADLLPALAGVHPGAERHVAALADRLRDEAVLLDALIDEAWDRVAAGFGLRAGALAAEPPALRPLLVRRLLARAGLEGEALAAGPVERVLGLLAGRRRAEVPGGAVARAGGLIVVERAVAQPEPAALAVPGEVRLGAVAVRARPGVGGAATPDRVAVSAPGPFVVRPPRPGDRLPLPGGGRQAVGRLLASAGVPARERAGVPVVAQDERVVWVAGHRADPDLLAPAGAPAVVLELS